MLVARNSSIPQVGNAKAKQTNCLEVFLSQICGKYQTLRTAMLNGLLIIAADSDWALSAIRDVEYIKPLEEYCEQTQPCAIPLALEVLFERSISDSETRSFLQTLDVPSGSTDSSSELVPFAGRLCSTLAERVSEMKSLFTESSPSDGTISALSATLPSESPLLNGNTVLEVLCEGFFLLNSLLLTSDSAFENILIDCDFVPLLKSTIIACLDLLDHERSESNCPHTDRTDLLINILSISWNCASNCLHELKSSLLQVVESTFSDVPQLCSLLERTCCHASLTNTYHLSMIMNVSAALPHLTPRLLEENLVERVMDTSNPMVVPTTNGVFHLRLVWAINNLLRDPKDITDDKEDLKRVRMLQFEQVLKPAKEYLQFVLPREEFIPKVKSSNFDLSKMIGFVLGKILVVERELFEVGEIVETGREEWEVVLLVEKIKEDELGERLDWIGKVDVETKKDEKSRWKKREERLREAGHEDAMEGWLARRDNETRSEIVQYIENVG
ncbi:hypothetical protein BLNAU_8091 [Blattamonas nauphoetae]|uniref:Uncharacterized protein n=1 Tax=Blattamonas nauphoetae TaxID=2049346 RepID=A0ABQ9XZV1_9EUKA|nr:hypothetical protein BLNAU_8091 [Blattamonas nauphoetae]